MRIELPTPGLKYEKEREVPAQAMNSKRPERHSNGGGHFFILGVQRSGTTMLRLMLDSHSSIAVPFESFVLIDFSRRLADYGNLESRADRFRMLNDLLDSKGIGEWEPRVDPASINIDRLRSYPEIIDAVYSAYARMHGKTIWGDKTPEYTRDLDVLNALFPQSRFVHLIRDGRDVALSVARQPWGKPDFVSALDHWREVAGWTRKMGRMLPPERYMELRYEDLVMQPEQSLGRVCRFLGVDFETCMLDFESAPAREKIPERSKPFHKNLQRGLTPRLAYKWQSALCPADQALAWGRAGELLASLNYPAGCINAGCAAKYLRRGIYLGQRVTKIALNRLRSRP